MEFVEEGVKASVRALLGGAVDYAGMFPPAGLGFVKALENYLGYREGEQAWMLGSFVAPLAEAAAVPAGIAVSAVGRDEIRWDGLGEVPLVARGTFLECPREAVARLAGTGLCAKLRTGGVEARTIPGVVKVAEYMEECRRHGLAFKLTAGLHHPVRGEFALTYAPDAERAVMHGFLNMFFFAVMWRREILEETEPAAFVFDEAGIAWRGVRAGLAEIYKGRELLRGFGSCSFEEPVEGLREMGVLV